MVVEAMRELARQASFCPLQHPDHWDLGSADPLSGLAQHSPTLNPSTLSPGITLQSHRVRHLQKRVLLPHEDVGGV